MKLNEIIDTKISTEKIDRLDINKNYSDNSKNSRSGYFSSVAPSENDPHMVDKTSRFAIAHELDAYLIYAKEIAQSKIASHNTYLPRIYEINSKIDDTKLSLSNYKIEKLIDHSEVSIEEVLPIFSHLLGDERIAKLYAIAKEEDEPDEYFIERVLYTISDLSHLAVQYSSQGKLPDDYYEALKFIEEIYIKHKKYVKKLDFKPNNFMFRRTPVGLQLVITDPLA